MKTFSDNVLQNSEVQVVRDCSIRHVGTPPDGDYHVLRDSGTLKNLLLCRFMHGTKSLKTGMYFLRSRAAVKMLSGSLSILPCLIKEKVTREDHDDTTEWCTDG
ncbi:hypothetical protein POM88_037202 [Heracleum sosnowskyi]|uniref:Uncharacterized protein n=1 Tax=Heracleum sosnowskyi TaxID=360622 RepID=A0AAD8HS56_9APIA|nr:hypothetical protein POM88_037202 [Heracleum sosnowskyi]